MKNENETKHETKNEGGCASGGVCSSCSCGAGRWTWIILALALAGVIAVKQMTKQKAAAAAGPASLAAENQTAPAGQSNPLPRFVDLGAGQCPSCKMMTPILADLKATYAGKMKVDFIDVWENEDAAQEYGIRVIPTQIFYDAAGNELFRHEGFFGKDDILAKWQELGVELMP